MIVRIVGEGQFVLSSAHLDELNEVDNHLVQVVAQGDEAAYREAFTMLLDLVRQRGQPPADDDLRTSDVVLPAADTSFEEAKELFVGEGLIPE